MFTEITNNFNNRKSTSFVRENSNNSARKIHQTINKNHDQKRNTLDKLDSVPVNSKSNKKAKNKLKKRTKSIKKKSNQNQKSNHPGIDISV